MNKRLYRFLAGVYRVYTRCARRLSVEGKQNLPADTGYILCCNHISLQDPMLLASVTGCEIHFMAKAELFQNKLFARLMYALGAFPVSRGERDLTAFRKSVEVLKSGGTLGIFPQGHRYKNDDVHQLHGGVALIALRADAVLIPARIEGPYRLFGRLRVRFGPPVNLDDLRGRLDGASIHAATERIGDAIFGESAQ